MVNFHRAPTGMIAKGIDPWAANAVAAAITSGPAVGLGVVGNQIYANSNNPESGSASAHGGGGTVGGLPRKIAVPTTPYSGNQK